MAACFLDPEEWYPVYDLRTEDYRNPADPNDPWAKDMAVEFTDEEVAEWRRVHEEFDRWQRTIGRRFGLKHTYNGVPIPEDGQ